MLLAIKRGITIQNSKMGSTEVRSFTKGIVWEGFSFIITAFAAYLFYGNIGQSIKLSAILTVVKIFLFFGHERAWKHIHWGKIKG